jgi:hypothetical protein
MKGTENMENENNKNYPFGRKAAQGFAQRGVHDVRGVPGREMPPGILGPTPLGAGVSSSYMPAPAAPREKPPR